MKILPHPQRIEPREGQFRVTESTRLFIDARATDSEMAAARSLQALMKQKLGRRPALDRPGLLPIEGSHIHLRLQPGLAINPSPDAYRLTIGRDAIIVEAAQAAGLYYGIQTLIQVVREFGQAIPAAVIEDWPALEIRGLYFDVSRGRIPTLETFGWLIGYLAERKINMLQLYIEHPFQFRSDPDIGQYPDALTSDDILELQAYCRLHRIDFVPSLQSAGHMGALLSMPRYRHLADVEPTKSWADMTWRERMRGCTFDTTNPETYEFLGRLYDEFLPLFDSQYINVCADETYDLGEGRGKSEAERLGKGRLYLNHIIRLNELCQRHGKRMMFWGDIVKMHPTLIPEIPKDAMLLNWAYDAECDYDSTALFRDAGLEFCCCPGTSGWNRALNDVNNADLNIRRYAATAIKYGARGLLNTDWGDHGHYNLMAGSLHGFALGAAMAWNPHAPDRDAFDSAWNWQTFGDSRPLGVAAMRAQSVASCPWTVFFHPFEGEPLHPYYKVSEENARALIREGHRGRRVFQDYFENGAGEPWISAELAHASKMNTLIGEKVLLARDLEQNAGAPNPELAERFESFAARILEHLDDYEPLWMARNRTTALADIRSKIEERAAEARRLAERLRG